MAAIAPTIGDLAIERAVSKVAERFRFILDVTPVNVEDQRQAFLNGQISSPTFTYRELESAPVLLAAQLDAIDLGRVEDDAVRSLLTAKHRELQLQIEMLQRRGDEEFVRLSEQLYGAPDSELVHEAELILANVPPPDQVSEDHVGATEFAALADAELAHYRAIEPDLGVHIEIRPDVTGIMVSGSVLFVSTATRLRTSRVDALLHHEVGTHLLTYANGRFQPIEMMASGFAGYEETQEGLAVLAEFLVGGLSRFRLRQLAARVLAVKLMLQGEAFIDVHQAIVDSGFSRHSAFTTTMRVFRSGGLTKDAIYLRGLLNVLEHLRDAGDIELLWMGKFSMSQLGVVKELLERGMLQRPRLRPRFLDLPEVPARLEEAASVTSVFRLIGEVA